MSAYEIGALIAVVCVLIAWALTKATYAIQRWADREVARQFDEAGVAYGPRVKYGVRNEDDPRWSA